MSETQTHSTAGDTPPTFKTKNAAWTGLASGRWRISRRTFFNHVPDSALYTVDMIESIARARGWPPLPSSGALDPKGEGGARGAAEDEAEKQKAEKRIEDAERYWKAKADREETEAKLKALELAKREGLYVTREEVERTLAAKAALFKMRIDQGIPPLAESIVYDCGGTPDQVADVRDRIGNLVFGELDRLTHYVDIMVEVADD